MDEKQIMEQKIRDLESSLSCNSSPIGDWKVTKCAGSVRRFVTR